MLLNVDIMFLIRVKYQSEIFILLNNKIRGLLSLLRFKSKRLFKEKKDFYKL